MDAFIRNVFMKDPVTDDRHYKSRKNINEIMLLGGERRESDRRSPNKEKRKFLLLIIKKNEC